MGITVKSDINAIGNLKIDKNTKNFICKPDRYLNNGQSNIYYSWKLIAIKALNEEINLGNKSNSLMYGPYLRIKKNILSEN